LNIFYLDTDPTLAAQAHFNSHVVKMPIEAAQLLSTAHHLLGSSLNLSDLYRVTHQNHPSAVWVRESIDHYRWTYAYFCALCDEYTRRYGKVHKTDSSLRTALKTTPAGISDAGFTPPPQCMPTQHHNPASTVDAYRSYYRLGKPARLHLWKFPATKPTWMEN
jgi:hypothetical protein